MLNELQSYNGTFHHSSGERGFSGPQNDHLLWQKGNVWLMDNHRLALWCWMQHWDQTPINFLHLDAHYDCSPIKWPENAKKILKGSLQDYRKTKNQEGEALIQWDNYLHLFQELYLPTLINNVFFTHHVGLKAQYTNHFDVWDLIPLMDEFMGHPEPWIINLDFDYFYARKWKKTPLLHEEAIFEIADKLRLAQQDGKILCLTLALSPECVGGWPESERLAKMFLKRLFA